MGTVRAERASRRHSQTGGVPETQRDSATVVDLARLLAADVADGHQEQAVRRAAMFREPYRGTGDREARRRAVADEHDAAGRGSRRS